MLADNIKDLLRFLRRDDPQTREVFKDVCKLNTVGNNLIPIMEYCQDDRNLVLNAVKVLVFLTMPVESSSTDITQQVEYLWKLKYTITCSNIIPVIVSLLESPLENLESEAFTEDDWKLVQLVLTFFRNTLAIQEISPQQNAGVSSTHILPIRNRFLQQLFNENVMDLILVLTQQVGGPNAHLRHDSLLLLETFYYLFMGYEPELVAKAHSEVSKLDSDAKDPISSLKSIMEEEKEKKKLIRLHNNAGFSQFSGIFTRLAVDGSKTLHKGNPLSASRNALMKTQKTHRGPLKRIAWDHGRLPSMEDDILKLLHDFINQFLSGSYNVLMQSIREDIVKEHHTLQNSDIIMFFEVANFITSFHYHNLLSLKAVEKVPSGDICGPIAESMNESMFTLVFSKWRDTYDGLKQTQNYKFLSATGSLMKSMIRVLDLVLKLSSEDSREPQTVRILLYKLFYDQTDQGMTQFLLNQITGFDIHKQAKSYLIDLVESIHVVIRLMENLQERGSLRVCRKSRKKRIKKVHKDKNTDPTAGDDIQLQNEGDNINHEVNEASSIGITEDFANINPKGNEKVPELDLPELDLPSVEEEHPAKENTRSDKNIDDLNDGSGDSSNDEQIAETNEVDFNVSTMVSALANNSIIQNLCWLLKFYKSNSVRTNHYILIILRRICEDLELSPMLYQLSLLGIFHEILSEQKSRPCKEHEDLVVFLTTLVRRMMRKMKSQPLLFVEILFWKARRECHYINCESLLHEVGDLRAQAKKMGSAHVDGENYPTQGRGGVHINIADALGDDDEDFIISHNDGTKSKDGDGAKSISDDDDEESQGEEKKTSSDRVRGDSKQEHEKVVASKRRKNMVLDADMEGKLVALYEKFKDERRCSYMIAKELDSDGKYTAVQVSRKLKQLGLTVVNNRRLKKTTEVDEDLQGSIQSDNSDNETLSSCRKRQKKSGASSTKEKKKELRAGSSVEKDPINTTKRDLEEVNATIETYSSRMEMMDVEDEQFHEESLLSDDIGNDNNLPHPNSSPSPIMLTDANNTASRRRKLRMIIDDGDDDDE
ncbi:uncharacterized protein LOC124928117 [Impatiens glandulifera]|uniref:uncharacterized protein LOC124928117 n=1 Tax=Impatiens glandulifera TaxID=253017 RepID=UPI001FB0744D|nr:uncharacterized protein LOC124928117 [Impatiens glandulifera]